MRKYCLILLSFLSLIPLNIKINATVGIPVTQIKRIGTAIKKQYFRWLEEYHPRSVSNLATLKSSSTLIHLKAFRLSSVSLGCNNRRILAIEITMFLVKSFTYSFFTMYTITHNMMKIMKRMRGSKACINNLKTAFDPNGPLIS